MARAIPARFGHQNRVLLWVRLDLLTQAVHVGFQRVGVDPGVVAPNLIQQRIARHDLAARAVEELQDRRFLFRQADLAVVVIVGEHLGRGVERVRPNGEDSIVGLLMRPHLCPQARHEHVKAERLGDVIVRPCVQTKNSVSVAVLTGQHNNRRFQPATAHQLAQIAAIHIGQTHIQDNRIEVVGVGELHGFRAVFGFADRVFFVKAQLLGEGFAQGGVVINQEDPAAIRVVGEAGHGQNPFRARGSLRLTLMLA